MGSEATWYRIVVKRRTTREEILRSQRGRFHDDPEAEPTSYLADSLTTAWREVTAGLGAVPGNLEAFHAWRVTLSGVKLADLRDPEERARHQITEAALLADPPSPRAKEVARSVRRRGYHGMIYQSVRNKPGGVCLVLFLDRAGERIELEAVSAEEWKHFARGAAP